jgi:hypothetical protein
VTEIVRPPRQQLVVVAAVLDEAVGDFLRIRAEVRPESRWEAPLEAWAISNLMIRNIESAALLARHDEALAPAAWANARNAFDAATRILWLLYPADRFESEARWVALLVERERFHLRMAVQLEAAGDAKNAAAHRDWAAQAREFYTGVADRLPRAYVVPRRIPSTDQVLREVGETDMYWLYIEGPQYVHATMPATSMYIDRSETGRQPTERLKLIDWILLLRTCWMCLVNSGRFAISRLAPAEQWNVFESMGPRVDDAFGALINSDLPADGTRRP